MANFPSLNAVSLDYLSLLKARNSVTPDLEVLNIPIVEADVVRPYECNVSSLGVMQFQGDNGNVTWIAERRAEGYNLTATHRFLPAKIIEGIRQKCGPGSIYIQDDGHPSPLVRRVYVGNFEAMEAFVAVLKSYFGDFLPTPTISLKTLHETNRDLFVYAGAYCFSD